MQEQLAAIDGALDPRIPHEVVQRETHAPHFAGPLPFVRIGPGQGAVHLGLGAAGEVHPDVEEFVVAVRSFKQAGKAAAFRVPHDHDVADVQVADRVFQRGADAVVMGVRLVGRDKVGDVPDDEQIAGRRVKEQDRVNPGVAAGDDEGVGMLADAEVFINIVFRTIPCLLEALESGGKAFEQVVRYHLRVLCGKEDRKAGLSFRGGGFISLKQRSQRNRLEYSPMPDFLRWIIAGVTSVVVAGLVFLLATVGIVVAFFVFLVLFVVFGLAMRRARKNVQYGEDGSRFIIYTNIPGAGTGNADRVRRDDPDTYELSPDEYTVEAAPSKKPGDTDPKALGDHGKS